MMHLFQFSSDPPLSPLISYHEIVPRNGLELNHIVSRKQGKRPFVVGVTPRRLSSRMSRHVDRVDFKLGE
mgnify:CR=1 FL=1